MDLFFYPNLTEEMKESASIVCEKYDYSYLIEGHYHKLKARGKSVVKLEDSLESWKISEDGLRLIRRVTIETPSFLYGPSGVACRGAELGVCIIWNNRTLTQMGYIMPESSGCDGGKLFYNFKYEFEPGKIKGDLLLDTVLYIKKPAQKVEEDEHSLINEAGVTVGEIDSILLDFDNINMDFPIRDVKDSNQPLWWLEFGAWEDPTSDLFNEDFLCLYLNSYYDCCPKVGDVIKNVDLLVEIITTAYMMIFMKIKEMGDSYFNQTINGVDLNPGSISSVMYYFILGQDPVIHFENIDVLHKSIQQNVERMLKGGSEE